MILVVAEQREGKLNRASWEAIAAAQQMAGDLPIKIVVLGETTGSVASDLASAKAAEVLVAENGALEPYTPDGFVMALQGLIEQQKPQLVALPHTYQTRDFAPALAARMRKALITDVTGIKGSGAGATFLRPMFQGKLTAEVKPLGDAPHFVTFQIGAFRADAAQKGGTATVTKVEVAVDASKVRQKPEAPFQEAKQAVDLSQAERIVAIGRGIKGQENLAIAEKLAKALGAEIAASRPICDNGWLPMERQIGSSGQTVAPKLYVALGISGAIQHLVGMKGSRTIVAVNKDADAPIFEVADYGIVGDLFEIAPALTSELERASVAERETLEVDVLIVGGGPAGLAAAIRLAQLQKEKGGEQLSIAVLEKAREAGAHELSGAVLDPSTLRELIPDFKAKGAPLAAEVHKEHAYFLTRTAKVPFPIIPPPLQNHGNYIISINKFVRWLSEQAEAESIDFFTGFPGQDVLLDGERVIGVRTGDRGIGKHGEQKSTFEPGVDIQAKVTIFCDGVRGNLTKQLLRRLELGAGRQPEQFAVGLKELWEVPKDRLEPGTVIHTMGYPLKHEEFGGAFIYAMPEGQLSVGFVVGLDYRDPMFDPHMAFNRIKQHPHIRALLEGGQMIRYGAKALPEGGWNTIPRVYMDGGLIAGDAGGFMNSIRLKGIHLAMRSGMLAAESAFEAVRAGDTSAKSLERYQQKIDKSPIKSELYPVRNVHQAFGYGLLPGLMYAGLSIVTRGWWIEETMPSHAGHERMKTLEQYYGSVQAAPSEPSNATTVDRKLTFDKLTNVHFSGTAHDEDQPVHLLVHTEVCSSICGAEDGHPCTRFCPANVYEIARDADGTPRLQINASNCVHCKTCDIMDPYGVITWVAPEGGGGPQYNGM